MQTVTLEYVANRFSQFVLKYELAMKTLGYTDAQISDNARMLKVRLASGDFKTYGDKPVHMLHGGKRITRFLIKSAIEFRPAMRERRDRLLKEYLQRAQEIRAKQPHACFFSFESTYARRLREPLKPFKNLFCI